MVRESRTIGGLSLIGVLYQRLAMLGVSFFVGPTATGWYSGASRIVEASKTGHVALAGAAYPLMAEADKRPGDRDRELLLHRSRRLCLVSGAVVSITLVVGGPFLVDHLYGSAFASARSAVVILALGVVPSTLATFQSLALFAQHRERDVLRVMNVCIGVLVGGMVTLVPAVGWIGACWAMLVADITQAALLTSHNRGRA
jgi:O-antigen/teichoic acid export membrane protein